MDVFYDSSGMKTFQLFRLTPPSSPSLLQPPYSLVYFPVLSRREKQPFFSAAMNELLVVDVNISLCNLIGVEQKLTQAVLGREFHVSLGKTVPTQVHQRDSQVAMLRQKLQSHMRYWYRMNFAKLKAFVNGDCTWIFMSWDVIGAGLAGIQKQIKLVASLAVAIIDIISLHEGTLVYFFEIERNALEKEVSTTFTILTPDDIVLMNIFGVVSKYDIIAGGIGIALPRVSVVGCLVDTNVDQVPKFFEVEEEENEEVEEEAPKDEAEI
ncbi:hypothetical protein SASPL_132775 [Salvia splendens]|uniref:U6 snRNA phosphodiesterase 1 n=1 Tax=Salvia splendens TaxID=180675 RepID=A0A8X8X334_SALSN|nr:hypothetical protein SASPL_132775 [Salvia splendens]